MITSELEKLASLRDRGDLSQAEFEKAKELLLSEENTDATLDNRSSPNNSAGERERNPLKTRLLVSILSTVSAAFAGGSAAIDPSPISLLVLALFVVASTLSWTWYARLRRGISRQKTP